MLPFLLPQPQGRSLRILCLGAHCDDIEIGCGGTLLTLFEQYSDVRVHWQVFSSSPERRDEALEGARRICADSGSLDVNILEFRDGYLPYEGAAVKEEFDKLKQEFSPDLIFSHYRDDLHQDHRKISELTWNTFRDHLILEYEIPKWDGDLGSPNVFVGLESEIVEAKINLLHSVYGSQNSKAWFDDGLFRSLLRIRGMEAGSPSRYAEGFYVRKALLTNSNRNVTAV